jgi:hypothetical protein
MLKKRPELIETDDGKFLVKQGDHASLFAAGERMKAEAMVIALQDNNVYLQQLALTQRHTHLAGRAWRGAQMVIDACILDPKSVNEQGRNIVAVVLSQKDVETSKPNAQRYRLRWLPTEGRLTCDCADYPHAAPIVNGNTQQPYCKHILGFMLLKKMNKPFPVARKAKKSISGPTGKLQTAVRWEWYYREERVPAPESNFFNPK